MKSLQTGGQEMNTHVRAATYGLAVTTGQLVVGLHVCRRGMEKCEAALNT